jgi:hypothetical protein
MLGNSRQRAALFRWAMLFQPGLLKPNKVTKVEITYIDAKQIEPDMLGYILKMKDASRLPT